MKKHVNIPVFIPHLGCPNQCVFCNQHTITGVGSFEAESVRKIIDTALQTISYGTETEIAFFGGSFTGIDRALMCELLEIAHSYMLSGRVSTIRCSTRPDYISEEILDILKKYGVKTIELGLQSSSEDVLRMCKRGHGYESEALACRMIVEHGFDLVGQMMIGLPGSTLETEEQTARFIIDSGAVAARIYPTVVFKDTELCHMSETGVYEPLSLDDAITRSAAVLNLFRRAGIEVIRIGLCASDNLSDASTYCAGPNHAAIGELVENEFYYQIVKEKIMHIRPLKSGKVTLLVGKGCTSKVIGQKRKNILRLGSDLPSCDISVREDERIPKYEVEILVEERIKRCT